MLRTFDVDFFFQAAVGQMVGSLKDMEPETSSDEGDEGGEGDEEAETETAAAKPQKSSG